jgi:hypothetical protein
MGTQRAWVRSGLQSLKRSLIFHKGSVTKDDVIPRRFKANFQIIIGYTYMHKMVEKGLQKEVEHLYNRILHEPPVPVPKKWISIE